MSESPTPTGNVYRLLGFIPLRLEEGVRNRHVNALYFGAFFSIGLLTFINVQQGYLFTNLGIPESEWGGLAGGLLLLNELVVLATVYLLGTLSDRVGRRVVYALAQHGGICYVLYPWPLRPSTCTCPGLCSRSAPRAFPPCWHR